MTNPIFIAELKGFFYSPDLNAGRTEKVRNYEHEVPLEYLFSVQFIHCLRETDIDSSYKNKYFMEIYHCIRK